jgi:hypothetical protein
MENKIYMTFNDEGFLIGCYNSVAYDPPLEGQERSERIPRNAIEMTDDQYVELISNQGLRKWVDGQIIVYDPPAPEPITPDRVSRRQFRRQLFDDGLLASVEAWVSQQDAETQMAYADAATFVRTDEMMQQGFAALGFTVDQVDAFFTSAAGL